MGKIYYIMGKSASGKDTIYRELLRLRPELKTVVPYTTRPIREGETEGVEYFFVSRERLEEMLASGRVIELRTYQTVAGPWSYFTADDGQFDCESDCLMIGTLESCGKLRAYFGADAIVPLYIETPDGLRLKRAIEREEQQKDPNYREICRRYLADEADFSEEKLQAFGPMKRFENRELMECLREILAEIGA